MTSRFPSHTDLFLLDHGLLSVVQEETTRFFEAGLGSRSHSVSTDPCSVEDVQKLCLDQLVLEKDCVFCLTIISTRSPISKQMIRASFCALKHNRQVRDQTTMPGSFLMRGIDTRRLFASSGRAIAGAAWLFRSGASSTAIGEWLSYIANHSCTVMLPPYIYHLRARVKAKGDRSVSLFSAVLGSPLNIKPLLHCYRGETGPARKVPSFEQGAQPLFD